MSDEASAVASEDTPLSLETSVLATSAVSFVASELVDTSVVSVVSLSATVFDLVAFFLLSLVFDLSTFFLLLVSKSSSIVTFFGYSFLKSSNKALILPTVDFFDTLPEPMLVSYAAGLSFTIFVTYLSNSSTVTSDIIATFAKKMIAGIIVFL